MANELRKKSNWPEFLQSYRGANSSKRLMGLSAGFVGLGICIAAACDYISTDKAKELNALIDSIFFFSGALLSVTVTEYFIQKKYEK